MSHFLHRTGPRLAIGLVILLFAVPVFAQGDGAESAAQVSFRGLNWVDWLIVGIYGIGMLALGLYVARRQKSAKDYFLAGGNMGSFIIGISMFATLLSTISYLAHPGEVMKHGPVILAGILGTPIAFVVASWFLIPALMKRRVTSAYELLHEKLGWSCRIMAACMFIALRLVWMALMLHIASKALLKMLDLEPSAQIWIVVVTGIVAVAYTTLGGLRAVVITDVVQFLLLFGGAVLTIALVSWKMDGFTWFPTEWQSHWDKQPIISFDPHIRVTLVWSILGSAIWWICTAGSDQTTVQRYMATKDVGAARRAFFTNWIAELSVAVLLGLTGLALVGYFMANPAEVPGVGSLTERLAANADDMFPHFIANDLPHGFAGLVVAALFAAAMSSLDSGINSVTAVVMTDFIDPLQRKARSDKQSLSLARYLTLGIGLAIVLLNTVIGLVPDNYVAMTNKTVNLVVTPLFSLFFMALFIRWATPFGAMWGAIYGLTAVIMVGFWDVITGLAPLSFQWISPIGLIVSLIAGMVLSLPRTRGRSPSVVVVWSIVVAMPLAEIIGWAIYVRIINTVAL